MWAVFQVTEKINEQITTTKITVKSSFYLQQKKKIKIKTSFSKTILKIFLLFLKKCEHCEN